MLKLRIKTVLEKDGDLQYKLQRKVFNLFWITAYTSYDRRFIRHHLEEYLKNFSESNKVYTPEEFCNYMDKLNGNN